MILPKWLLFIEPSKPASAEPVIDELTKLMTGALCRSTMGVGCSDGFNIGYSYRGVHTCACGAYSTACDHLLPGGEITNSLAAHYLAYHRAEIPKDQLKRVRQLAKAGIEPVEPTTRELMPSWH